MTTEPYPWIAFPPDWRWITVGFCYCVLGHLLPISVLEIFSGGHDCIHMVPVVWSLGGLAAIALFVGYRSRNVTVFEAVIACAAYALMMDGAVANKWTDAWRLTGFRWMIVILPGSIVSAVAGEVLQSMRKRT
jgi:hypothetical protein